MAELKKGRALAAAVSTLAVVLLVAGPAGATTTSAQPTGRITDVTPAEGGSLSLVFAASALPEGASLDPASVKASIDGTAVPSTATPIDDTTPVARTAVLAIDTSGSMAGAGIEGAKAAADSYLAAAPADVEIGLVTFDDGARVLVPPTTDRAKVASAVDSLQANGSTALYDAVVLSSQVVGRDGTRGILVLSDGADEGSRASLSQATSAATKSGATLDAAYLGTDAGQIDTLKTMASATGGKVVSTGQADELAAVFSASARALSNQLAVVVTVPAELASSGSSLTITAAAGDTTISDTAFVPIPGAPQASASPDAGTAGAPVPVSTPAIYDRVNEAWLWVGLAAIFLGVAIMLGVAFLRSSRHKTTSVRGRMSIYTLGGRGIRKESETTNTALGSTQVARSAVEFADRAVRGRDAEQLLERKLDAAGLPLKPGEWALVHVGIAVGSGLLLLLLTGGRLLPALIGLLLGVVIPWLYLTHKESRRQAAFYSQLPDTLQLLAGSLASGYSLPQAVDTVVREGQNPMSTEFNRALVEARLGVPIEEALDNIAERMNSEDFHWVVLAIRVQRDVGGNLAEVLTTVAATLRERERLRRQVQVLSAEGRLSAVIIALIPIMFALFLVVVRPEYIQPLYTTVIGLVMLGFGALMMLVGIIWLRRVVQVEV